MTEELGDVLFAAVKVGRFAGVDPEVAIHGTCEKFIRRYRAVEEGAAAMGEIRGSTAAGDAGGPVGRGQAILMRWISF